MMDVHTKRFDLSRGLEPMPRAMPISLLDGLHDFATDHTPPRISSSQDSYRSHSPPYFVLRTHHQSSSPADEVVSLDENEKGRTTARTTKAIDSNDSAAGLKSKVTSAERRATHNAIERARREILNERFLQLARALPTMTNVKRPSKNAIVNKSLEWICESQVREHQLMQENANLRAQIKELREQVASKGSVPHQSFTLNSSATLAWPQPQADSSGISKVAFNDSGSLGQPQVFNGASSPRHSHY